MCECLHETAHLIESSSSNSNHQINRFHFHFHHISNIIFSSSFFSTWSTIFKVGIKINLICASLLSDRHTLLMLCCIQFKDLLYCLWLPFGFEKNNNKIKKSPKIFNIVAFLCVRSYWRYFLENTTQFIKLHAIICSLISHIARRPPLRFFYFCRQLSTSISRTSEKERRTKIIGTISSIHKFIIKQHETVYRNGRNYLSSKHTKNSLGTFGMKIIVVHNSHRRGNVELLLYVTASWRRSSR